MGGMLARALSAYDLKVCVLEKENDVAMGATHANSGIVHAGYDAAEGSLKARLNVRGSRMMQTVAGELGVPYRRNGSLVIGFGEEDECVIRALYARGISNGVKELRILEGEEARTLEPALSDQVSCALYAPTAAIVCPYELAIAAIGNAMDNGVDLLLNFEVRHIDRKEGCYEISSGSADAGTVRARYVVNAAGVHADEIAQMAGDASIRIHPRRGEYLLLDRECGGLVSHTIFRTPSRKGKGILVTPTVDGNVLLGPTSVDMEDKEDYAVTEEGIARILQRAGESVRDIPCARSSPPSAGCGPLETQGISS